MNPPLGGTGSRESQMCPPGRAPVRINVADLLAAAATRPPGYVDAIMAASEEVPGVPTDRAIDQAVFATIRERYLGGCPGCGA